MPTPALPTPAEAVPARIDPERTTRPRSAAEIRQLLDARQSDVQFRLQALKDEFTNPASVTVDGVPLPDALRANAVRNAGLAVAGGLALGLLLGLRARRQPTPQDDFDFVRARVSSFLDDAAEHVRKGASSAEAVRRTLRSTPMMVAPPAGAVATEQAKSSIRQAVDLAVKSAVGFALKAATDQLTQKLTGKTDTLQAVSEAPDRG